MKDPVSYQKIPLILTIFFAFFCRALFEFFRLGLLFFFPASENSISGDVALVTGAGQGIGRALALELAKKGAIVICVDIREETNQETKKLVPTVSMLSLITQDQTWSHQGQD